MTSYCEVFLLSLGFSSSFSSYAVSSDPASAIKSNSLVVFRRFPVFYSVPHPLPVHVGIFSTFELTRTPQLQRGLLALMDIYSST
jgi:hypothetical protein